jgi:hypothetical protein
VPGQEHFNTTDFHICFRKLPAGTVIIGTFSHFDDDLAQAKKNDPYQHKRVSNAEQLLQIARLRKSGCAKGQQPFAKAQVTLRHPLPTVPPLC